MTFDRPRLIGALLSVVFAATVVASAPAVVVGATTVIPPLPACSYQDVLTARRAYTDWAKTLLDPIYMVPSTYWPPNLEYTSYAGITGGGKVRSLAISDLKAMTSAAKYAGSPIKVTSAYRSYATQASLFNSDVQRLGYNGALLHTARPGHSEHQLGTAVDFGSKLSSDTSPDGDWAHTHAGAWMAANAWKYGWVMSYPYGKTSVTCYEYEPWHYRYFGRTVGSQIHYSGLTVREWLWQQGYGQPAAAPIRLAPAA